MAYINKAIEDDENSVEDRKPEKNMEEKFQKKKKQLNVPNCLPTLFGWQFYDFSNILHVLENSILKQHFGLRDKSTCDNLN